MSRNKKTRNFQHNPFRDLKGLSVSGPEKTPPAPTKQKSAREPGPEPAGDFATEMERLGVKRFGSGGDPEGEDLSGGMQEPDLPEEPSDPDDSDEALFLAALEGMETRFEDGVPVPSESRAAPRRMKLLRQGRLVPEDELDLHGMTRSEVAQRVGHFLDDALYQGLRTVLVITGRGIGSGGEPVLRTEVERFLDGKGRVWVSEWGKVPRRYGGEGALVVFLRSRKKE